MKQAFRLGLEKTANRITKGIAKRYGESFPFFYVAEYPKSGGTWLSRMVADYLQLPFPQHYKLPIAFPAVLHVLWTADRRLNRVFYLYRDGRDVMVSLFFDRIRIARFSKSPSQRRIRRIYEELLGSEYAPERISELLPKFIDFEFTNPGRGSSVNWRDHVEQWMNLAQQGRVALLSYEQLLQDCQATLARALQEISGENPDPWRLKTTVEKHSMQRKTGRQRGEEDQTSHIRKGVAGDWVNFFNRESAELFNDLAGETLIRLGYEKDRNWVERYPRLV